MLRCQDCGKLITVCTCRLESAEIQAYVMDHEVALCSECERNQAVHWFAVRDKDGYCTNCWWALQKEIHTGFAQIEALLRKNVPWSEYQAEHGLI